jgi:hypothetical protein
MLDGEKLEQSIRRSSRSARAARLARVGHTDSRRVAGRSLGRAPLRPRAGLVAETPRLVRVSDATSRPGPSETPDLP